jgi:hypothetical protein
MDIYVGEERISVTADMTNPVIKQLTEKLQRLDVIFFFSLPELFKDWGEKKTNCCRASHLTAR